MSIEEQLAWLESFCVGPMPPHPDDQAERVTIQSIDRRRPEHPQGVEAGRDLLPGDATGVFPDPVA
jgi:hypothetical protein